MTDYRAHVRATERAVAEHESAHQIAAELGELPRDPRGILVLGGNGRCWIGVPPYGGYRPAAQIAAFLAGGCFDDHRGRESIRGISTDLRAARSIAGGDDELFGEGLRAAWNLTQTHAPAIQHLARAIVAANGRLVGDALGKAIDQALAAMPAARRRNERMNLRAIARRELFEVAWAQREQALIEGWRPNQPAPDMTAERLRTWREADRRSLETPTTP